MPQIRLAPSPSSSLDRRIELIASIGAITVALCIGTLGYMSIEGWNAFDSFYMTVITLATIGYGETHPLSTGGRVFTIFLIFLGVGVLTVVLGSMWRAILEGQLARFMDRKRKMEEKIKAVHNHTIFCGYSRLGRTAATELRASGDQVVIVELDEHRAAEAEQTGFLVIRGDATIDETLAIAGISRAARLVSLLPRDSDNLYVILTAREANPSLYIVSRAEDDVGERRLSRAGVDRLISTYRLAARKLTDGLLRPFVTDFFEIAGSGDNGWKIEEIKIPSTSPVCGRTLKDLNLRQRANVGIAAIISPQADLELNPTGETVVASGSTLIAIGWKQDIAALEKVVLAG
jgi:voltage-gated potassium channel